MCVTFISSNPSIHVVVHNPILIILFNFIHAKPYIYISTKGKKTLLVPAPFRLIYHTISNKINENILGYNA